MDNAPEGRLDPTARDIYDLLRRQPGDSFTSDDVAAQLGLDAPEVEAQLEQLKQLGLIERAEGGDAAAFVLSPSAPEL